MEHCSIVILLFQFVPQIPIRQRWVVCVERYHKLNVLLQQAGARGPVIDFSLVFFSARGRVSVYMYALNFRGRFVRLVWCRCMCRFKESRDVVSALCIIRLECCADGWLQPFKNPDGSSAEQARVSLLLFCYLEANYLFAYTHYM